MYHIGWSVAIGGDLIVCGAPFDEESVGIGSAHVFAFETSQTAWRHKTKLRATSSNDTDMGYSVAIDESVSSFDDAIVIIGEPQTQTTTDNEVKIFELENFAPADTNGDGVVDVEDLINVILCWGMDGDDCPNFGSNSDADCNGIVDVDDLVEVILNWSPGPTICAEFLGAGLSQQDCDEFLAFEHVEDENYRCWLAHYLTSCGVTCTEPPACPGGDPFGNH